MQVKDFLYSFQITSGSPAWLLSMEYTRTRECTTGGPQPNQGIRRHFTEIKVSKLIFKDECPEKGRGPREND